MAALVSPTPTSGRPVQAALDEIQAALLIRRAANGDDAYSFKHALVQETAYASLLHLERKRLHRLVGETLESSFPERRAELAVLLAQHFENAGDAARALEYAVLAADAAARLNANTEALAHYTRALELAEQVNSSAAQLQELYLKRGRVLELRNDHPAALENYDAMTRVASARSDRAMELAAMMARATIYSVPTVAYDAAKAQALSDEALQLARALQDKQAEAKILWNLLLLHSRAGDDYPRALAYGKQALEIARTYGLRERIAFLLNDMSLALVSLGDPEQGEQYNLQARALWREFQNLPMLADNFGYAAVNYVLGARYEAAIAASEQGARISRDINNEWSEAWALTAVGTAYWERGDIATAEQVMLRAIALGERVFPPALVLTANELARLYADLGDPARAIEVSKGALAVADAHLPKMRSSAVNGLAHAYLLAGEIDAARQLLGDDPPRVDASTTNLAALDLMPVHIELAICAREFGKALEWADSSLAFMRRLKIRMTELETLMGRASALLGLGRLDPAAATVTEAVTLAQAWEARWSMWQGLALAARIETARGNPDAAKILRAQARELVQALAAHTPEHLRTTLLNSPAVASLEFPEAQGV